MSKKSFYYNKGYTVDDIIREINQCDKEYGVKLRRHNPFTEPEQVFDDAVMDSKEYLSNVIAVLNGIDPDDYFVKRETQTIFDIPGERQPRFTELSDLEWEETNNYYDVDSFEFKCRFLTLFICEFMTKLEKISMNKFKESGKLGTYEYAYFYLSKVIDDLMDLVTVMLTTDNYGNLLLRNHQNFVYSKNKINHKKYNKTVYDAIYNLKDGMKVGLFNDRFMSDDMIIYTLLRIAYMVSTNDLDLKHALPKFKHFEGATKKHDLIRPICDLGSSILREHKYSKRPLMYKAYNDACPVIKSNYEELNDDWYLSIGIRSLAYVDFLCCDKDIHKFIKHMINK